MAGGFIKYWEHAITQPNSPEFDFVQKMVRIPKIVFSATLAHIDGRNVQVEGGPLLAEVQALKNLPGHDILMNGGAGFVSSLIENGLIDELNFFVNPVAIGSGLRVFGGRRPLELRASVGYASGIVVNTYAPK